MRSPLTTDIKNVMKDETDLDAPTTLNNTNLFDIENMVINFDEPNQVVDLNENISDEWDSEDDFPLARIQDDLKENAVVWTEDIQHVTRTNPYLEKRGPNVPQNLETTTDLFLHLFAEDLTPNIVFKTNLYALQKSGDSS
ncbi:solute carrier family 22 member [Holotrichia oblita]|uniref:Solute carrier family 22 member n=1 Tax=Holotrichia oblita TaxID=644536 RepID=A0ACB9TJF9_HOLOL|nr:solute carrier family 22 member [Holotrichia oblita]